MKSGPRTLRSRIAAASTAALLLATAPRRGRAQQLRRGGSSAAPESAVEDVVAQKEGVETAYSHGSRMLEDEDGFEIVGRPLDHVPHNRDYWRRSMLREEVEEQEEEAAAPKERFRLMLREEEDEAEEEEATEPKERIIDDSLAFVDPNEGEHERREWACNSGEMMWLFRFRTDEYGYETSWKLEKKNQDGTFQTILAGPPGYHKYQDNTHYAGSACIQGDNMYKLTMFDSADDGICCNFGRGHYQYEVGGFPHFDSTPMPSFTDQEEHLFYAGMPVPVDDSPRNGMPPFSVRSSTCGENEHQIGFKITTDNYGYENSWELRNVGTNEVVRSMALNSYGNGSTDQMAVCVPPGNYRFTITDGVGDGICCQYGNGHYELYMDGRLMIYGSDYNSGETREHDIIVGYDSKYSNMDEREIQWLNCHNWRRKKYHERFGSTYVPLKYDMSLAAHAQNWADALLSDCEVHGITHEPGVLQGENLAKNTGSGKWGWMYPVENICRRWFEREETWGWPENAHLTQGLWRSGRYVGCAESEKTMNNGGTCRVQVCRYARAGNCSMKSYDSSVGDNWKVPMLQENNPCGPTCPPNGCH